MDLGRFGRAFAVEVRQQRQPTGACRRSQRQSIELGVVDAQQPGDRVGHLGCVERAGQRQEAIHWHPRTRRPRRWDPRSGDRDTVYAVPEVPSDSTATPGCRPRPECGSHVVAGSAGHLRSVPLADDLGRTGHSWHDVGPVEVLVDDRQDVPSVLARRRRPVSGAGCIAAIGDQLAGQPHRHPVVRQHDVGQPGPVVGLAAMEPAQLGDGERGDRHAADCRGPVGRRRPATASATSLRRAQSRCRSTAWPGGSPGDRRRARPFRAAVRPR